MKPNISPIWYPLVHGRTYEVDYRANLLAVPPYFTPEDVRLVAPYILAATGSFTVEGKRQNVYHHAMFRVGPYCVFGLGCMAHQICTDPVYHHDMTQKRVLPLFLGYITKDPCNGSSPQMEVDRPYSPNAPGGQFSELFRYVVERWLEKPYQSNSTALYPVKADEWCSVQEVDYARDPEVAQWLDTLALNTHAEVLRIWPATRTENTAITHRDQALWTKAWREPEAVSLCLGLSSQSDALHGLYTNTSVYNVSITNVASPLDLQRPISPPITPEPSSDRSVPPNPTQTENSAFPVSKPQAAHQEHRLTWEEYEQQEAERAKRAAQNKQRTKSHGGWKDRLFSLFLDTPQNASPQPHKREQGSSGRRTSMSSRPNMQPPNGLPEVKPLPVQEPSQARPPVSSAQSSEMLLPSKRESPIVPEQAEEVLPESQTMKPHYSPVPPEQQDQWDFDAQTATEPQTVKPRYSPIPPEQQGQWDFGDTPSTTQRSSAEASQFSEFYRERAADIKRNPSRALKPLSDTETTETPNQEQQE